MEPVELDFDVVIAGGGFAGVYCARALAKELGRDRAARVALLADQNFMVFQPMLAEVAGSSLSPRHVVNPIRRLCRGVTVLRGSVASIDMEKHSLRLEPRDVAEGVSIRFGHLALVLGGIVDLSRVPGMPEHAYLMKNVGDALQLRAAVIDRFEEAQVLSDPEECRRVLTFVIVGGGYSGVETSGQIFDLAREMLDSYPRIPPAALRVVLIHSGDHLLPDISASLGRYCEENLAARGIEIILGARVTAMTATRVHLGDGRCIETHTVVSTVGNAQHPVLAALCRSGAIQCEKGRILTESSLRVLGHERLWAAGDCAAVPMHDKGNASSAADQWPGEKAKSKSPFEPRPYCPPTAQFAMRQGKLMGENIARVLRKEHWIEPFTFTGLGELAAIGHHSAVAEVMGLKFSGFIAWFLWRTVYLSKLPGLERKLRVVVDWTLDLFFPRDIALFQPHPTELLDTIHLEPGDQVVRIGEAASSLYVVKSGKLEVRDAAGAVLRTLTAGEQLGKQTIRGSKVWGFDAFASEATTLVSVSARVFEAVAGTGANVEEFFAPTPAVAPAPVAPVAAS